MEKLQTQIELHPAFQLLNQALDQNKQIQIQHITGSFRAFIASYVTKTLGRPLLYLANDLDSAERMYDDLKIIVPSQRIGFLPAVEFEPYGQTEPSPSQLSMRIEAMQNFLEADRWITVATPAGLSSHFPVAEDFLDNQLYLQAGHTTNFDQLVVQLDHAGLKREDMVEKVGDFSVRGGIIDLFVWNYENPLRIEFFGNEIESIRIFDVFSQRSIGTLEEITILPNLFQRNRSKSFITKILPAETVLFIEESQIALQKNQELNDIAQKNYLNLVAENIEEPEPEKLYLSPQKFNILIHQFKTLTSDLVLDPAALQIDFKLQPHPDFAGSVKRFLEYLRKNASDGTHGQIILQALNQNQAERLLDIIEEEKIPFSGKVLTTALHSGFIMPQIGLTLLTDHEIFNRFKRRKTYKRFKNGEYLRQLNSLNIYDYVVHIDYGVGQYLGMEMLDLGPSKKECIKIAYRDGDHLFVTVDNLSRVQKFSSEESTRPHLTKLGTAEWERTKLKTKESLKKIAAELIRIYAARKTESGYEFAEDGHWQKELEASFIYEETEDQLKSILEVKSDMESTKPMDRLLCGDVGFGKTEVALRAAFKSILNGKQVALLVPTTILAFQHFETFKERLKEFPVRIEMLNRFRSPKQQKQILEGLVKGTIDLVIGTHRLLSQDVLFKDLGLLVVDEEQRFGVKQKEKLKKYRLSVDILSMTATPIPRTLHMALMGARDLSNIDTPPANRLPVHTEIINWDDDRIYDIIGREIERGGQIYFVHNRVETILAVRDALQKLVPQARVAVGHGQLPEKQLEKVMLDFMHHKYDVLVASMIIENGLDIPNVNTIIINRADKFGLSQLYQLRGRVGRSNVQAYAYLLIPPMDKVSETARKRLRAIQDFTDLGSGYKVALRDLEIRGAGNLLGKEQSGFVQTVGFDLYCKILDEAVKELKEGILEESDLAEEATQKSLALDTKLDVDFDLLIPETYIPAEMERIAVYHRLVNFSVADQIGEMKAEMEDRFGKPPQEVLHFLSAIELKLLAGKMYAKRIIMKSDHLKLFFSEEAQHDEGFFKETIPALMNQNRAAVRFMDQQDLAVEIQLKGQNRIDKMDFAKIFLRSLLENS